MTACGEAEHKNRVTIMKLYNHINFLRDASMGLTLTEIRDTNELTDKHLSEILQDHRDYIARLELQDAMDYYFWNLDYFDEALVSKLGFDDLIGEMQFA